MRDLIITADDFGAAITVNAAVERAHRDGVLSAASVMVGGGAFDDAVERARRLPSLRVGLHIVLVEGRPVSAAEAVPDLIDARGRFRTGMVRAGFDIFLRPEVRRQLSREIEAQFQAFAATGLPLDHVNTHKHFHLHPTVLGLILRTGRRFGMKAMRVPVEPRGLLARADASARLQPAYVTAPWAAVVRARLRHANILTADRMVGLQWSGAMTAARLKGVIDEAPAGITEIYLHPALEDRFEGSAPGYRYREEFAALTAPEVLRASRAVDIRLGGFSDFAGSVGEVRARLG